MNYKQLFLITTFLFGFSGIYAAQAGDTGNMPVHEAPVVADAHEAEPVMCVVCRLNITEPSIELPACHHRFHRACIADWLVHQQNCPLCRIAVDVATLRQHNPEFDQAMHDVENICTVCQNPLGTQNICEIPECHHRFHTACLAPWLAQNRTCPNCRGPVDVAPLRQQHPEIEQALRAAERERAIARNRIIRTFRIVSGVVSISTLALIAYLIPWHFRLYGGIAGKHDKLMPGDSFGVGALSTALVPLVSGTFFDSRFLIIAPMILGRVLFHVLHGSSSGLLDSATRLVEHSYCFGHGYFLGLLGVIGLAGLRFAVDGNFANTVMGQFTAE